MGNQPKKVVACGEGIFFDVPKMFFLCFAWGKIKLDLWTTISLNSVTILMAGLDGERSIFF